MRETLHDGGKYSWKKTLHDGGQSSWKETLHDGGDSSLPGRKPCLKFHTKQLRDVPYLNRRAFQNNKNIRKFELKENGEEEGEGGGN